MMALLYRDLPRIGYMEGRLCSRLPGIFLVSRLQSLQHDVTVEGPCLGEGTWNWMQPSTMHQVSHWMLRPARSGAAQSSCSLELSSLPRQTVLRWVRGNSCAFWGREFDWVARIADERSDQKCSLPRSSHFAQKHLDEPGQWGDLLEPTKARDESPVLGIPHSPHVPGTSNRPPQHVPYEKGTPPPRAPTGQTCAARSQT